MKTIAIGVMVGVTVLALGSVAWAGGDGPSRYGAWHGSQAVAAHRHNCGHWWGWLVPGHREDCCTWGHGQRPGGWRGGPGCGECW